MGRTPGGLLLVDAVEDTSAVAFGRLVGERARRIPLQHLTGEAWFRHVRLLVGPGVFIPRPETEVMTGWAIDQLRRLHGQPGADGRQQAIRVVELGTGSGAIALSIATELPGLEVHAVEVSEDAARWAARNLSGAGVELHVEDMATALGELDGTVDLVIANPPYIPLDAYLSVPTEVRDHDPVVALFSGDDGLDALRVVARVGARLLRGSGLLCAEHADVQGESAPAVLSACGAYRHVRDRFDLAGRPRFVTAVRCEDERAGPPRAWQDGPSDG